MRLLVMLLFGTSTWLPTNSAIADEAISSRQEFSGSIIKRVNGKKHQAQVFAKGDRLRLEYKYAIRTDYGYAAIEIIRLDQSEAWYLLAQQKRTLGDTAGSRRCAADAGRHCRVNESERWLVMRRPLVARHSSTKCRPIAMGEWNGSMNGSIWKPPSFLSWSAGIAIGRLSMNGSDGLRSRATISMSRRGTRNVRRADRTETARIMW